MYKAKINQKKEIEIAPNPTKDWDIFEIKENSFHILQNNKSYKAEIVNADIEEKTITVKVNGNTYNIEVKDKMDLLLEKMGMSNQASKKIKDIKAPMPGLVLEIKVAIGDEIKKGESILILEAMKMENSLKSPGDGIIKSIQIKKGEAVEKNQVLLVLE